MAKSTPTIRHFAAFLRTSNLPPSSLKAIQDVCSNLTRSLGLKIVKDMYFKFRPGGITFIHILSQSHLAVHSWPEHKLIHIDLVVCVNIEKENVEKAINISFNDLGIADLSLIECKI